MVSLFRYARHLKYMANIIDFFLISKNFLGSVVIKKKIKPETENYLHSVEAILFQFLELPNSY